MKLSRGEVERLLRLTEDDEPDEAAYIEGENRQLVHNTGSVTSPHPQCGRNESRGVVESKSEGNSKITSVPLPAHRQHEESKEYEHRHDREVEDSRYQGKTSADILRSCSRPPRSDSYNYSCNSKEVTIDARLMKVGE